MQIGSDRRWVIRETHRAADGSCLYVALDVTAQEQLAEENARLHQQVEDLKLTDDLTGLPNKRAISQALDLHVSRSRRYQNPLSVVLVHIDLNALSGIQPLSSDPVVLAVSRFLRDRLRWVDQIARWEDNLFLLVLPETTEADARGLLDKIAGEQDSMLLPESYAEMRPKLAFGLACWKKGDDIRTCCATHSTTCGATAAPTAADGAMSEAATDDSTGPGRKALNRIVGRFLALCDERLLRIRATLTHEQRSLFDLLPLLWHVNHPMLPGFVSSDTPAGMASTDRDATSCCWPTLCPRLRGRNNRTASCRSSVCT